MRISRERKEEIGKGGKRKGGGGVAGEGVEDCVKILDGGNHQGGEKGEGRGGSERG